MYMFKRKHRFRFYCASKAVWWITRGLYPIKSPVAPTQSYWICYQIPLNIDSDTKIDLLAMIDPYETATIPFHYCLFGVRWSHLLLIIIKHSSPWFTIINHYLPWFTIINHYLPLLTIIDHYLPLFTIMVISPTSSSVAPSRRCCLGTHAEALQMEALRCHPHGPGDHHQKQNAVHQDGHGREDHHAYSERGGIVKSKWWRMILIWYYIYYIYYIYTYIYNVYIYGHTHTPQNPPEAL